MSGLSVLIGVKRYRKSNVDRINVIDISGFIYANKSKWYGLSPEEDKFDGELHIINSEYEYRKSIKTYPLFDYTYESKAWDWMIKNRPESLNHLFWVVGVKIRLKSCQPIKWNTSGYQSAIDKGKK